MIRCKRCARFTRNNVALRGFDQIKSAHGDCSRCGRVEVQFDAWEDWGWSEEDEDEFFARLTAPGVAHGVPGAGRNGGVQR